MFIAQTWLKELEREFCLDLVKDSSETLIWLEELNTRPKVDKKNYTPFTFDFESLYDSLDPKLVLTALRSAMDLTRSQWTKEFKDWIIDLVQLSIDASIGEFHERFFRQRNGLPTGGSLIVEIANITVFYVLKQVLFDNDTLCQDIVSVKRYIDDGIGIHTMTKRRFDCSKNKISSGVSQYGLKIKESDWLVPSNRDDPINFLDINIWFDKDCALQTYIRNPQTLEVSSILTAVIQIIHLLVLFILKEFASAESSMMMIA